MASLVYEGKYKFNDHLKRARTVVYNILMRGKCTPAQLSKINMGKQLFSVCMLLEKLFIDLNANINVADH